MSSPHKYFLCVVIRRLDVNRYFPWRVVAYAGRRVLGSADFSSTEGILRAFQSANLDFDHAALSHSMEHSANPIVFAAEMELSYQQLCILEVA